MAKYRVKSEYPYVFLAIFALTWMLSASYNSFIPVFLNQIGFSKSAIGVLLAIGPAVALVSQPVWGSVCDRSKVKNSVLKILLVGSALFSMFFLTTQNYYLIFLIMIVFTFFYSPVNYITDAITLEYLEDKKWKYGPIRLAGTVGYALLSILVGILAKIDIRNIFFIFVIVALSGLAVTFGMPKVKGYRSKSSSIKLFTIFKNRELMAILALNLVFNITFGFLTSFFPVYYSSMGADSFLVGIAMFISSMSELPFLIFADKVINKLGIKATLLISSLVMGTRLAVLFMLKDIYIVLAVCLVHGMTYIVFAYCTAIYMNKSVPKELKALGQTINGFIAIGIARIIGNIGGGVLSDKIGIGSVFLVSSAIEIAAVLIFIGMNFYGNHKKCMSNRSISY